MAKKRKNKKPKDIFGIVDNSVGNFENHPFFVKKADEARKFLRKAGLPPGFPPVRF